MAKKNKQDKRRARAKAKAKARAGSTVPENQPGYRNPKKIAERAAAARARKAVEEANARRDARECGDCTACCTVLGIPSLRKPAWTPCPQLCEAGCGVYEDRPTECREYLCAWRQGMGGDDERPDQLGVIFDLEKSAAIAQVATGEKSKDAYVVMAREAREGGFEEDLVKVRVQEFVQGGTAVAFVHGRDGITVFGSKHPEGVFLPRSVMEASNARVAAKRGTVPKPAYRDDMGETAVEVTEDLLEN